MDLIKQFFSFDKLMKDRLVAAFFYLGLVIVVMKFLGTIRDGFQMMDQSVAGGFGLLLWAFFQILFLFILLRLVAELMIAIFHINDNLSPDGGKADTADIDVIVVARDAATKAAKSASVVTKSVVDKTRSKISEIREDDDEDEDHYADYEDPMPKPATKTRTVKKTPAKTAQAKKPASTKPAAAKPAAAKAGAAKTQARKTPAAKPAVKKPAKKPTATKPAAKKAPATKTNVKKPAPKKPTAAKPSAKKTTTSTRKKPST